MFCTKCGKEVKTGSGFCTHCGQPLGGENSVAEKPAAYAGGGMGVEPKVKKKKNVWAIIFGLVSILLAAALVLTFTGVLGVPASGSSFKSNSIGFDTPEDAINYFMDCVNNEDYEGALRACAVDEIAENYDYEAMIIRLNAMMPNIQHLPSEYGMYKAFNRVSTQNTILRQLSWMALSVSLPEEEYSNFLEMSPMMGDDVDFDDVVDDMDPEKLKDIEIVEIEKHSMLSNPNNENNMQRQADCLGADELTFRDVLYEIDGDYYAGGFILVKYDEKWLISALQEPIIGQPVTGALMKVSGKSEFNDMLG